MKLSICMIAHNEEAKIAAALQSAAFADELIVVDCESRDKTGEIAKQNGARVFIQPNRENLNVNKNFSFEQACGEWIFCLDADELISVELADEIKRTVEKGCQEAAFFIPRKNHYFGKWLKYGGQYPDWQLRLVRRDKAHFAAKHVHERIQVAGKTGRLKAPLLHYPYDSKGEAGRKLDFYTSFEAKHLLSQGIKPSFRMAYRYLYFKPVTRFVRRYIFKLGFLDGSVGLEAIKMDMANFRLRYRKLVDLYRQDAAR
ncbi:glycosyltransferase family 2 protein [bacterium]|nr:glycosyltransferase family 2 protein [bacterium]MBU1652668.1 glycosyltransferase family 2 protein [bacterium]